MSETVKDAVQRVMRTELGVDDSLLTDEADVTEDLGADSLDKVELVMALENEFNRDVPDEDADQLRTVGDFVAYFERRLA